MTHGSLFSGIGGAELAAQWAGWENVFHCEINPFGRKVLDYYWPKAKSYADIKQTDFSIWRNRIDILTGGFPCQPFSAAGKRKGTEDDRHLWPEMLRAIQEIQPRYIVGENVRGFVNWGGGWYSTRCYLTWKTKATKSHRFYFHLAVSTPRTDGTEYGLLPTPIVMDTNQGDLAKIDQRRAKALANKKNGNGFGQTLGGLASRGLLPTVQARDRKDSYQSQEQMDNQYQKRHSPSIALTVGHITGQTSQLNPRFVAEMMGYPPNWTELPFLSGETKA